MSVPECMTRATQPDALPTRPPEMMTDIQDSELLPLRGSETDHRCSTHQLGWGIYGIGSRDVMRSRSSPSPLQVTNLRDPRVQRLADPNLSRDRPPTCMAVIEPQHTMSGAVEVLLAVDGTILTVDSERVQDNGVAQGIVLRMAVAPSGQLLACFTHDGARATWWTRLPVQWTQPPVQWTQVPVQWARLPGQWSSSSKHSVPMHAAWSRSGHLLGWDFVVHSSAWCIYKDMTITQRVGSHLNGVTHFISPVQGVILENPCMKSKHVLFMFVLIYV